MLKRRVNAGSLFFVAVACIAVPSVAGKPPDPGNAIGAQVFESVFSTPRDVPGTREPGFLIVQTIISPARGREYTVAVHVEVSKDGISWNWCPAQANRQSYRSSTTGAPCDYVVTTEPEATVCFFIPHNVVALSPQADPVYFRLRIRYQDSNRAHLADRDTVTTSFKAKVTAAGVHVNRRVSNPPLPAGPDKP